MTQSRCPIAVLISGSGSNLQAIIDAQADSSYSAEIAVVISNKDNIKGLERARQANIPVEVVPHTPYPDRETYDRELSRVIDQYAPRYIILAGFMRILSDWFVNHYQGQLLNIHPSLLPKYKGLNTHQQAIDNKEARHGATVHFVTPELDGGPLILQATVPVLADDSAETLASRVLRKEHVIYPMVIDWVARDRLRMEDGMTFLDNQPLTQPIQLDNL